MSSHDVLDGFEERLLASSRRSWRKREAMTAAPTRRPRRRLVISVAAATALAVVGVLVAVLLPGLAEQPAYAVIPRPGRFDRVYIRDYRDPKGLQRRLEAFGVKRRWTTSHLARGAEEPEATSCHPIRCRWRW
jgi:hypothetical protein